MLGNHYTTADVLPHIKATENDLELKNQGS